MRYTDYESRMKFLKKALFLVCFGIVLVSSAFAKSFIISPLPLPQQEILNVDTEKCSSSCLLSHFAKGEFFSFVAKFDSKTENSELRSKLSLVLSDLGIMDSIMPHTMQNSGVVKLALLMPKKIIGRYSTTSIDTILAYLMTRGNDFIFEIFDSGDESVNNIRSTYNKIVENHFDFVIAIFTPSGAQTFVNLDISLPTYLPTIHKNLIKQSSLSPNLIFGGIDYGAQIDVLLKLAGDKNIVAFNDKSAQGNNLGAILRSKTNKITLEESIDSQAATTFTQRIAKYERACAGNVVFFNTPAMNTGLIASQLALAKKSPSKLLSTQINFNPSLLLLIQKGDRKNLFITSVINNQSPQLVEYAALLGGDLRYNWVNYSTAIGVEQLLSAQVDEGKRFFKERVQDSQVQYVNKIYRSDAKNFYED